MGVSCSLCESAAQGDLFELKGSPRCADASSVAEKAEKRLKKEKKEKKGKSDKKEKRAQEGREALEKDDLIPQEHAIERDQAPSLPESSQHVSCAEEDSLCAVLGEQGEGDAVLHRASVSTLVQEIDQRTLVHEVSWTTSTLVQEAPLVETRQWTKLPSVGTWLHPLPKPKPAPLAEVEETLIRAEDKLDIADSSASLVLDEELLADVIGEKVISERQACYKAAPEPLAMLSEEAFLAEAASWPCADKDVASSPPADTACDVAAPPAPQATPWFLKPSVGTWLRPHVQPRALAPASFAPSMAEYSGGAALPAGGLPATTSGPVECNLADCAITYGQEPQSTPDQGAVIATLASDQCSLAVSTDSVVDSEHHTTTATPIRSKISI